MAANNLKKLGFDLAYLSLLTKAGLKPLSRWEKDFGPETERLLHDLGLKTRTVRRSVRSGRRMRELVFSKSGQCLDLYLSRFDGAPIDPSPANMRIEGLLFGYPSCCVESYIAKGYVKNSLRRSDQRILFHWACAKCPITPLLLPHYREVYGECREAMRGRLFSSLSTIREAAVVDHLRRAVVAAASLVALSALPTSEAKYYGGDPHRIPLEVWEDTDADFLKDEEEVLLHTNPAEPDEDGNQIPDGVDLALALSGAIDLLPDKPSSEHTYIVHILMYGVEYCDACGEAANMGIMEIINPLEKLSITVPYIAKHYMEHGSFSYDGNIHRGRLNVPLLNTVLGSEGLAHFTPEPEGTDADNDGLRDWEEPVFETDPENRDTDGDGIRDGLDLSRELRAEIGSLPRTPGKDKPYVVEHPMDGIEICPRCGAEVVMDIWDVINPATGASISIPSMALHFMDHGGFAWEGGYLFEGHGRVAPRQIKAVLTGEGDGHWLHVSPDADGDFLADQEELDIHTDPGNPDENGNEVLDGVELAEATAAEVSALPGPSPSSEVHRLDFQLKGLERCDICGAYDINMGHLTVVNPMAQLYVKVPYIALHYMEHGSFSFAGSIHGGGRLDVKLLLDALHSPGPGHMLAVPDDPDGDGLKDHEEEYFHTNKAIADTNIDGVPDGFGLAHQMWEDVNALPNVLKPEEGPKDCPFVVAHMLRGLEACDVCGAIVNMGWIEVINRKENINLEIRYIGLHYMRHGSFSYGGDLHGGRVNPCLLDLALRGDGTSHLVILPGDKDADGLLDNEEAHFGTRPDVPDSDGDGILDGVELARKMHGQIEALPAGENPAKTYVIHYEMDCYLPCPVCGEELNCGNIEITNPLTDLSIAISYMNLHFMEMGSFAASAEERVDPLLLESVLRPGVVVTAMENQMTLTWKGAVGKKYQVFTAADPSGPWAEGPIFDGDGTELVYTDDGTSGASSRFYKILTW